MVTLAVGAAGTTGTAFTITGEVDADMQVVEAARRAVRV